MSLPTKDYFIKELDRVFSIAVRKKDADENGFVKCITCISIKHWSQMTCGHWRKRRHISTRWMMENCGAQCSFCNCELQGNEAKHEEYINKTYGEGMSDELNFLSNTERKITIEEMKELINKFRKLI